MDALILGTAGFFLYFIYDINSVKWKLPALQKFFAIGSLGVIVSTIWKLIESYSIGRIKQPILWMWIFAGMLFLALLIYTLFFALPFEETYLKESGMRMAYTEGMYGLCRHPGVLWFAGFYLCLWGITGSPSQGIFFVLMILWNVFYVIFQDLWTFPRTFINYAEYKCRTPFLIPDRESIHVCVSTIKGLRRG